MRITEIENGIGSARRAAALRRHDNARQKKAAAQRKYTAAMGEIIGTGASQSTKRIAASDRKEKAVRSADEAIARARAHLVQDRDH